MHPLLHTKDNTGESLLLQTQHDDAPSYILTVANSGCEQVMLALEECHAKGFMWKAAGMCNNTKKQLVACLRAERTKSQDLNRSGVEDKRTRIRQKWKEIDENS